MAGKRTEKIADRIHVIVAELLERRVKDPRLGFVTITDVKVTGDNQHASVFYTHLGEGLDSTISALESAKGMIRSEVGKQLGLRHTPTIEFFPDAIPESAAKIEDLLKEAHERDAQVASQAANAQYAGEENPYKETE